VNFVSVRGGSRLSVRSYERGVEAETLSCGSGVVASAVVAGAERGQLPPVSVATRSGSALVVDFRLEGSLAHDVTLTGDARVVFEGLLKEEAV
jgi:diaminopimelate epimerase